MIKQLTYSVSDIEPYINWLYFYFAWGLHGKPREEKERMKSEALNMIHSWDGRFHTHARFGIFPANGDGDDLIVNGVRIPLLRQ